MRIAVALPGLRPDIGGGFTFVEEVARAVDRCTPPPGVEVVILTDAETGAPGAGAAAGATAAPGGAHATTLHGPVERITYRREDATRRVRRRVGRLSQRLSRLVGGESGLEQAAKQAKASIVWLAAGGSEAIDVPFVATVWDVQHRTHPWFPEVSAHGLWRARDASSRELLGRAALVVCGTEAGARELDRWYRVPRERIVLAPHPTPGWALEPGDEEPSAAPDGPFFLYPAQFWPHKNHAMLLRAFAERRRAGSRASLVLVGGDLGVRSRVEALAQALGVAPSVRFTGFVDRRMLRALYRRATALVYPAFSGPENLPPLEAFALGCPVANAEFPGAREQLGDAALYFDPMDAASIAAAMAELEGDPATRSRLVEAGRRIALERTGDAYVDRVLRAIAALRPQIDPFDGAA